MYSKYEPLSTKRKIFFIALITSGCLLVIEHILSYDGLEYLDIFGHETIGVLLIVLGVISAVAYRVKDPIKTAKYKLTWYSTRDDE